MTDTKLLKHALDLFSLLQRDMMGSCNREGPLQLDGKKATQKVISIIERRDKSFGENAQSSHVHFLINALSIRQSNVYCVAAVTLHASPYISSYMPFIWCCTRTEPLDVERPLQIIYPHSTNEET